MVQYKRTNDECEHNNRNILIRERSEFVTRGGVEELTSEAGKLFPLRN